ncbi:hypothetical protein [Aquabacterium sp.]|uniref:hypothetical protein n=1 Tax=Aquabacterium sp. TaxID=1872578 RepID=UPI004038465A
MLYSNLEEYERKAKMIGDILYLAQTDNQLSKPDLVDMDLTTELDALFEYFEPWVEERHIQLKRTGQIPRVSSDSARTTSSFSVRSLGGMKALMTCKGSGSGPASNKKAFGNEAAHRAS